MNCSSETPLGLSEIESNLGLVRLVVWILSHKLPPVMNVARLERSGPVNDVYNVVRVMYMRRTQTSHFL